MVQINYMDCGGTSALLSVTRAIGDDAKLLNVETLESGTIRVWYSYFVEE